MTHFSGQLGEATDKEKVIVAGMVTRFRPHLTKDGKAMGFVTLEDIQGNIELILFPRTWEQFSDLVVVDQVIMAEGKVDASGGDPKVLVDRLAPVSLDALPADKSALQSGATSFRPANHCVQGVPTTPGPCQSCQGPACASRAGASGRVSGSGGSSTRSFSARFSGNRPERAGPSRRLGRRQRPAAPAKL